MALVRNGLPSLAVIIPALNEARNLPRLLSTVLAEAEGAHEVLVVDGGSTDGTPQLARSLGARVILTERGRGRQLAAGARASEAEVLLFLHADCVPAPGALRAVRAAFLDPLLIAGGMRQEIDGSRRVYRWIERASNLRVRRFGMVYGDSGLAVRHAVYAEVGGFADFPIFEDVDLCRRLAAKGNIGLIEAARLSVSARRWENDGVLLRTARNWLLTAAYLLGVEPDRLARHYAGERGTAGSLRYESGEGRGAAKPVESPGVTENQGAQ